MFKRVYENEKFPPILQFFIDMYMKEPSQK